MQQLSPVECALAEKGGGVGLAGEQQIPRASALVMTARSWRGGCIFPVPERITPWKKEISSMSYAEHKATPGAIQPKGDARPTPSAKCYEPTPGLQTVIEDRKYEVCLEQYKAYLGDLGNIGTRYATVQGFYVSVIAALVSVLALAESGKILSQFQTGTLLVVCSFGFMLCIVWALTIHYYGKLFGAKFDVLKALEANLAYKCFDEEYKVLRCFDKTKNEFRAKPLLTRIEVWIPIVFSLFFIALALIRLHGPQPPA
jgi:hypothetical protein